MFNGILIEKDEAGYRASYQSLSEEILPAGDVTVAVQWSSLNYKDGLALTGASPVVRRFPLIPGIDFAGTVLESQHPDWHPGDKVVLNGWGVGETHSGGLAERARVRGDWLVALPERFQPRDAMAIGTAGYTAMLCVMALEKHGITPGDGDILVTGANGGVGSVAITLLAKLGYRVVAATGRLNEADYLTSLGAAEVIDRAELATPGRPLANACATTRYGGAVAACGLAGGMDFPSTVMPFILRGVTLYGIDSVMAPRPLRQQAWARLAEDLDLTRLHLLTREVPLSQVVTLGNAFLAGQVRGRILVNVQG